MRLENDQRRAQLLALGRAAFAQQPYDDVSIDDIAKAAGISKGLLYHYFPAKRDLYLEGLRATSQGLVDVLQTLPAEPSDGETANAAIRVYLSHIEQHAAAYLALMRGGIGSDPVVTEIAQLPRIAFIKHGALDRLFPQASSALTTVAMLGWIGCLESASMAWLTTHTELTLETIAGWLAATLVTTVEATRSNLGLPLTPKKPAVV